MPRYDVKAGQFKPERNGSNPGKKLDEWIARQEVYGPFPEEAYQTAPMDPTPRPEHPTLGGPLFWHGVPAALNDEDIAIVKAWYDLISEDIHGHVDFARLLLARAGRAALTLSSAYHEHRQEEAARQKAARAARETFANLVFDLQHLMQSVTTEPASRLRELESELHSTQKDLKEIMMKPGVPAVAVRRYLKADAPKAAPPDAPETQAAAKKKDDPDNTRAAESTGPEAEKDRRKGPDWKLVLGSLKSVGEFLCYATGGSVIGLCFGIKLHFLDMFEVKQWDPSAYGWMGCFSALGTFGMYWLGKGLTQLWESAATAAAEEPVSTSFVNWRSVRHTMFPLCLSILALAVEASIVRNTMVASKTVMDPTNLSYFLGALPVILPTIVGAGAFGRPRGRKQARKAAQKEEEREDLSPGHARREAKAAEAIVAQSPEAQPVVALAYWAETLQEKIASVKAEIADLLAPYQQLLAKYREDLEVAPGDPDFRKLLGQAYVDAVAAFEAFLQQHQKLARHMEGPIGDSQTVVNHIYIREDTRSAATKPSYWQRFTGFLTRLFRRRQSQRS